MKDLSKSFLLALVSIPITLISGMVSMDLIHSSELIRSVATLTLLPAIELMRLLDQAGLTAFGQLSSVVLAFAAQFFAYFVVIHVFRNLPVFGRPMHGDSDPP